MGTRLGSVTRQIPKCMVPVNGIPLIDRLIDQFLRLAPEPPSFVIAIGYLEDVLRGHLAERFPGADIRYVSNPDYSTTNNIYSLYLCRESFARQDTILAEADLIYDDAIIRKMLALTGGEKPVAAVAPYEAWMDGTMVKISRESDITSFVTKQEFRFDETAGYYKTMNIYYFPRAFTERVYCPFLETYIRAFGRSMYYEQVLSVISFITTEIKALVMREPWYEIDDLQDLDIAQTIFSSTDERYDQYHSRYGGFWRFPRLIDFCYLVNPLFPPAKMKRELAHSFDSLIQAYPSGQRVNAMTVAKNFALTPDYVAVGNGAAEIIAVLARVMGIRRAGMVFPSFDEYTNRFRAAGVDIVPYQSTAADCSFRADDLIRAFRGVDTILLINPNNPTGFYLDRSEVLRLADAAHEAGQRLLLDESFIDFCSRRADTLLSDRDLSRYPNLYIIKSISKSYGIPGLRLGFIAGSDVNTIAAIRREVGIWNINSVAEYWLQIFSKYKADFDEACCRFQDIRARFMAELSTIGYIEPIPTEANFVMCRVRGISSERLVRLLANDYNIMAANCALKANFSGCQAVRFAVRDDDDNQALVRALRQIGASFGDQ